MLQRKLIRHWLVRYEEMHWGPEKAPDVLRRTDDWLPADLPCDIHMPLLKAGLIKEPLEGMNSFDCEWMERKSWWFKNEFTLDGALMKHEAVELSLASLDAEADIFLNGRHLGHHRSAFHPFTKNVKELLTEGSNVLLVRVTSGLEHFSENDVAFLRNNIIDCDRYGRGDERRTFARKPQYAFGWDWGPRVPTCGIMGDATLTGFHRLAVRGVRAWTKKAGTRAEVAFEVELEGLRAWSTTEAAVTLQVMDGERVVLAFEREVSVRSGINFLDFEGIVDEAKLWWPNGMGTPHLYKIRVAVETDQDRIEYPRFRFGIRTIRIDEDKINERERWFAIEINGVRTFCKGANWIPADSIYARVSEEKYTALVREAKEANFNMLRIWGGGLYEPDVFYEKCDEMGIMLWHDFMFGCGLFPDHLAWFRREAEMEMEHQTRRLRNHPSLALWCGDNEDHWAMAIWSEDGKKPPFFAGGYCYNELAPRIVRRNCPDIPYWNGSPYGGEHPNGTDAGDRHHWREGMMNPDMEIRITPEEYDRTDAKFISEYGYVGPCRKSSIEAYHGEVPPDRAGEIWQYHTNFYEKQTVNAGIAKHYADAEHLTIDEYLLYAGLCQGLMYGYSLEALRFKEHCSGGLFWMFNDCWGEVGWSIVDYYLKRKISYYFVKRAFAPVKLILRQNGDRVKVVGINETPETIRFGAEAGYVPFDGKPGHTESVQFEMPPFSRSTLFAFSKDGHEERLGVYAVRPIGSSVAVQPAILRSDAYRNLRTGEAKLTVSAIELQGDEAHFTVSTDTFAHAVHFDLDDHVRLSDEYFDLLPGEKRKVTVYGVDSAFGDRKIVARCLSNSSSR
ncbi:beta-mannosidase [Cohnella nanjingensis]|uniref:beta-mannosidase n=1 Tax=Cohnella nanjingensis TaxID=1387779 RepID=A0A7X0RNJ1_9BACL|nr:glycoside hydrolase family 2 protein [Cohnella nanjingensis]MBB6670757.1 beta-mannosidase [Cohnella nanjingensis]